jgi:CubicO group peptidase (beta-lactamase class C family)
MTVKENSEKQSITQADFELFAEQVRQGMERTQVPGVAVGILYGDQEYSAGFGVTSIDNALPVTPQTLFQIGSTSKTVTATAVMRLVEQGKVDLDAPVRKYIPDFKVQDEEASANVKVRDLFTHTAGWAGDFFIDTGIGDDATSQYVTRMAELPQVTPLGSAWSYNNASFVVAGKIIEAVTGKSYEVATKELIFEPLGMKDSFFFPAEVMTYRFAVGHHVFPEGPRVARPWPIPRGSNSAGGISTTIPDQFRYARFHLGDGTAEDGTRVLSPESVAYMQSNLYEISEGGDAMGLSWMLHDMPGAHIVRHGGGTNGQISAFMLVPEKKFALIIVTNANKGTELNNELTSWAFKHFLGASETEPEFTEITADLLASYAGNYHSMGSQAELTLKEGGLEMLVKPVNLLGGEESAPPPPPPTRLNFISEDKAIAADGPYKGVKVEFSRKANGSVNWLRMGSRIATRQ